MGAGDGSFQVVCPTVLEVDLEMFELVTILSRVQKVFPYKKETCNCRSPLNGNIFSWIVRRASNAISDRNKTETLFALRELRNRKLLLCNSI